MDEKATIEVADWALDEAANVVAFVDGGGLGAVPEPLIHYSHRLGFCIQRDPDSGVYTQLTRDFVEALRDFAFPWVEVSRSEVRKGDRVRTTPTSGVVLSSLSGLACDIRDGSTWTLGSSVQIRRPRKRALTLGDLEPGTRFQFVGVPDAIGFLRTVDGYLSRRSWIHRPEGDPGEAPLYVEVLP